MNILLSRDTATVICDLSSFNLATPLLLIYNLSTFIGKINVTVNIFIIICALVFLLFRSACYSLWKLMGEKRFLTGLDQPLKLQE